MVPTAPNDRGGAIVRTTTRARRAARILATLGFAAVCLVIFYLTVQSPVDSMALSSGFDRLLKALAANLGTDGAGGAFAQLVQSLPVRRLGHAGEFFAFGLLASLLVIAWLSNRLSVPGMVGASLALCVVGSLFDQTHKLFVPVRHFDWKDLPFDACGYAAAIFVVFACYGLVKALTKRSGCRISC